MPGITAIFRHKIVCERDGIGDHCGGSSRRGWISPIESLAAQLHDRCGRGRMRPLSRSGGVRRRAARSGRAGAHRRMASEPPGCRRRHRRGAGAGERRSATRRCRKLALRAPARLSAGSESDRRARRLFGRPVPRASRPDDLFSRRSRNGAVSPPRWSWRAGSASRSAWTRPACWRAERAGVR